MTNVLILYASMHGCSEKCAFLLYESINASVKLVNLNSEDPPHLNDYDLIIFGGSIHMGTYNFKLSKICQDNKTLLLKKKIAFYVCYMDKIEHVQEYLKKSIPNELIKHAVKIGYFGGEFEFDKMNEFEINYAKKVAGYDKSTSKISIESIYYFSEAVNNMVLKLEKREA